MNVTSAALDWARRAPIVKAMDRIDALQAAPDDAIRIFRQSYANEMDTTDPKGTVDKIVAGLKGYWHKNLFVQVWCGAHPTYEQLATAVVYCHMNNLKCGTSWFTGDYTQQDWDIATQSGVDAYMPQCYWGAMGFTTDHALRYRQFWRPGQAPVMILECGRDKVEGGKGGWKLDGLTPEQYASEIMAYEVTTNQDSYVLGKTPFTNGPTPGNPPKGWDPYDMDPISPLLTGGTPTVPAIYTPGFDISNNNGNVNWAITGALKGYQYVSIKATEGKNYKDAFFLGDWQQAKTAGLVRQAYDFGRPSQGTGHDDAQAFLSVVEPVISQFDSVCLDLEDTNVDSTAGLHDYAMDWLTTVEQALGFKPMFYSGRWYTGPHDLEGHADLAQYGLWIASYTPQVLPDISGMGWAFWAALQYGSGPLPGINGPVDFDIFNGTIDQLKKYGKP